MVDTVGLRQNVSLGRYIPHSDKTRIVERFHQDHPGVLVDDISVIDPDVFAFIYTVTIVIMVISGGKGTLAGPIVGGLIFGFLPVAVRSFAAPEIQWILYGLLMIIIVFVLPTGIVPAIEKWFLTPRKEPSSADSYQAKVRDTP